MIDRTVDAAFRRYAERGAYHWTEVGGHWIKHNAFTAERYRRVIALAGTATPRRMLDVGCGDGAFLWMAHRGLRGVELHGLDPNPDARRLAREMLDCRAVRVQLHADWGSVAAHTFDVVTCSEVIEHVNDPAALLLEIRRVLAPGGTAILTTPIRLTEEPQDPNHRIEWFPNEFRRLCEVDGFEVVDHQQHIPAGSVEAYFWRPRFCARVPVFRLLCNWLSIYGGVNALTWLAMRRTLMMLQIVVLRST